MAPRRRISPETNLRDPGLRPVASPTGGFNDVSNLLRYQNQFRNVVDFTDLSSTLNRVVGYLGEVKAEQDRLSTEGGDLAGAVIEKSLKNNYKTYNEMIQSLDPEQRTALSALGPIQSRIFADNIAKHSVSNLETRIAAAIKEETERPQFNENGEANPPPDIVGRVNATYTDYMKQMDSLYSEVPLIGKAVRNASLSALNAYQSKAALTEGTLRANHAEQILSANVAKQGLIRATNAKTPEEITAAVDYLVEASVTSPEAVSVAQNTGKAKETMAARVNRTAVSLANQGHFIAAREYVVRAYEANGPTDRGDKDKGFSLLSTFPEGFAETLKGIDSVERSREAIIASEFKKAEKPETLGRVNAFFDKISFKTPNVTPDALWSQLTEAIKANDPAVQGVSLAMIPHFQGMPKYMTAELSKMIDANQTAAASSEIREADSFLDAASSQRTATSITNAQKAIDKIADLNPNVHRKFQANLDNLKNTIAAESNKVSRNYMRLSEPQRDILDSQDYTQFFQAYVPNGNWASSEESEIAGKEIAMHIVGYDDAIAAVVKNNTLTPEQKETERNKLTEIYNGKVQTVLKAVQTRKEELIKERSAEGAAALAEFNKSDTANLGFAATKVRAAYDSLAAIDRSRANRGLVMALDGNPKLALAFEIDKVDAAFLDAAKNYIVSVSPEFREELAVGSTLKQDFFSMLQYSKKVTEDVKAIIGNASSPEARMAILTSPEFLKLLPSQGAALANLNRLPSIVEAAFPTFMSNQMKAGKKTETGAAPAAPAAAPATGPSTAEVMGETKNDAKAIGLSVKLETELSETDVALKADPIADLKGTSMVFGEDTIWFPLSFKGQYLDHVEVLPDGFTSLKANQAVVDSMNASIEQGKKGPYGEGVTNALGSIARGLGSVTASLGGSDFTKSAPTKLDQIIFGSETYSTNLGARDHEWKKIVYTRHKLGKFGNSFRPIMNAYRESVPNPSTYELVNAYKFIGVPSEVFVNGSFDAMTDANKIALQDTHHGMDWNDFQAMWDLDKPLEKDDVRIHRFEKLSDFDVDDAQVVGKNLKDVAAFQKYARTQHALHLRLNGQTTPKEFSLKASVPTITYDEMMKMPRKPTFQMTLPTKEQVGVNYDEDEFVPYVNALNSNYEQVKKNLRIDDATMKEYTMLAAAIALQETRGGDNTIVRYKWGKVPVPAYVADKLGLGDSVGITQINTEKMFDSPEITGMLNKVGITKENYDPWNPDMQAKATLSFINAIAPVARKKLEQNPNNKQDMSDAEMIYYQYTAPGELVRGNAKGDRITVKNVKKYFDVIKGLNP